jgi:ferrous iron transport protein A
MHDMLAGPIEASGLASESAEGPVVRLSQVRPGDAGVIVDVRAESHPSDHGLALQELQRRLLEFGFVEGAQFEVLHEGAIRRDPIALRLEDMRVALRRRDAEDVWVRLRPPSAKARAARRRPRS